MSNKPNLNSKARSEPPQNARQRAVALEAAQKRKTMIRRNVIISFSALIVAAVVVTVVVAVGSSSRQRQTVAAGPVELVRENSVYLARAPGAKVTVVEFLDFECEACGALYPTMEEARKTYGNKVNFVARYFPIQSHLNSMRSARAVEAAGQQGQWEAMYQKMFEKQTTWAERKTPQDDIFRGFAREIGVDMAAWEKAYNDPLTEQRITADQNDGLAIGVEGTPTLFVNGEKIQLQGPNDLNAAIDKALAAG